LALIVAGVASAHADLVRSNPATNSTLEVVPAAITIDFSEAIEPAFSKITVLFEDGSTVDNGDSAVSPLDPRQLIVSLNDARQGTYIVSWRVLSAVDGHITSGAFVFSVGKPINQSVGTDQAGGAVTSPIDMLARALTFIGQALMVGLVAFRWLVWRPALKSAQLDDAVDEVTVSRNTRLIYLALGLTAIGAIITLLSQSALNDTTIWAWLGTRVGRVWIGRVATLIAIGMLAEDFALAGRGAPKIRVLTNLAVIWLSAQILFLTTLTSHSAAVTQPPIVPFAVDWLHLIAMSIWVGGLAQLALSVPAVAKSLGAEDRSWLWLKTVVTFSTAAALALGVVLLTGAYLSMLHVGDWAALISTSYGQALLVKLAIAGVAMLIGAYNLIVTKPQLDRAIDQPDQAPIVQRRFRRVVIAEAAAAVLVVAAAGVLTNLPRSKDPQPVAAAGALTLTTRADEVDAALTIDPARSGLSNFALKLSENGQPIDDAAATVSLRFTYLVRSLGTTKADAARAEDGSFVASGPYLSLPGEWQIEAAVRRPDAFDVFAAYRVKVNLDGAITIAGAVTIFDQLARWLSIYNLPFGGSVAIGLGLIWLIIGWKAARNTLSQILLVVPTVIAVPIGVWSIVTFAREATPGLALTNPYLPDDASLAAGKTLFEANCAVCHGEQGRGNGLAAASLSVQPPDFGNGHLDIHTDGDVFYWIQNGPSATSPMPAFKDKLSEDEIWHLVNYVRRLRNEATSNVGADLAPAQTGADARPAPTLPSVLQPYTPPSFIANEHGATQVITPTGDAAALALLSRSDAAMNALTSLVEDQIVRDNAGNELRVRFEYNTPDRMQYHVANGATSIQIGEDDYQPAPDGAWIKNARGVAFAWPNFFYAKVATDAKIESSGPEIVVAFRYNEVDFRVQIETATGRMVRYSLDGSDTHVTGTYSAFNAAPKIEAPVK
ncbi:MAG: copper resistance protein CopC, partial [Chloroflexi bacterium]|nr:copper resistance protein CopC [Chloroflexota bacterium]